MGSEQWLRAKVMQQPCCSQDHRLQLCIAFILDRDQPVILCWPLVAWGQNHEVRLFLQVLHSCRPVGSSLHLCHHMANRPDQGSHPLKVTWPLSPLPPPSHVLKATTVITHPIFFVHFQTTPTSALPPTAHDCEHSLATTPPGPSHHHQLVAFVLVWF